MPGALMMAVCLFHRVVTEQAAQVRKSELATETFPRGRSR